MKKLFLPVLAALICVSPSAASAATLNATPSTFPSVYSSASAGDTIELASGNYGTFAGSMKSGEVIIKEQTGATASMALRFNPASHLTLDGLTITSAELADSRTKNITVRNSEVTGRVTFRTSELQNANILFMRNRHVNVDVCDGCPDARVWLPERVEGEPSGITIRDSEFTGGSADGIQNGSHGTRIIGNTFHNLTPGGDSGAHVDAVQLLGSKSTLIKGNYFHNLGDGVGIIMAPDGMEREVIEDNVVAPSVRRPFIDVGSDDGSRIHHNTFADGACEYNLRCGTIRVDAKESCPWADACDPGRGTVITNNIAGEVSVGSRATIAENSWNLLRVGSATNNNIIGLPTYVGPLTSMDGFRLAAGSLGKGNASDGLDRGARFGDVVAPPPPPPPPAEPPPPPPPPAEPPPPPPPPPAEPEPEPEPDYNPVCKPLCDKVIAELTDRIDRIHVIADRNVYGATRTQLRDWMLEVRAIVHE